MFEPCLEKENKQLKFEKHLFHPKHMKYDKESEDTLIELFFPCDFSHSNSNQTIF